MADSETQPITPPEWTDKQRAFVAFYVGECNLNGTRAAIKAGYSKRSARQIASENLSKPYLRAEIDRLLEERTMSRSEVLARLALHGRGDMREFIGKTPKQIKGHPDGALVKKIKHTITTYGDDRTEEKVELELYDAQAALVQIGRYHGLFTDTQRMDGVLRVEWTQPFDPDDIGVGEDELGDIIPGTARPA